MYARGETEFSLNTPSGGFRSWRITSVSSDECLRGRNCSNNYTQTERWRRVEFRPYNISYTIYVWMLAYNIESQRVGANCVCVNHNELVWCGGHAMLSLVWSSCPDVAAHAHGWFEWEGASMQQPTPIQSLKIISLIDDCTSIIWTLTYCLIIVDKFVVNDDDEQLIIVWYLIVCIKPKANCNATRIYSTYRRRFAGRAVDLAGRIVRLHLDGRHWIRVVLLHHGQMCGADSGCVDAVRVT